MTGQDAHPTKNNILPEDTLEYLERKVKIRTAQLLEANQQLKKEIAERKRAEQITRTLFRISNAISTTKHIRELYATIHRILGEIIDLRNFYIALYHKQARKISFPYFIDQYDSDTEYSDEFSEGSSLTGEVILAQKPVFLHQQDLQQRVQENRIIGTIPKIWLGVPLKIQEEVIGIMATQSYDDPHHFDLIDLDVLHAVSDQVALAIERKRYEQAIVASEQKYRNILASIEDGYYEINLHGNLTLVNQAMCKMLGYDESEILGRNTARYLSEQTTERIKTGFANVLDSELPGNTLELEFKRKDGTMRFAETIISAIRNENDEPMGFRGIARDITERKAAENSRKLLEEQLQQAQRLESLGTLAGGVAHDFNNLLMGIQGRTVLMLQDLPATHPHYSQLRSIEEHVESAAALTTRLLGFARGGKYEVRTVDLNSLIEKSVQMYGRTKKEITIHSVLQLGGVPAEVAANQIEQVLLNLLVNAGQAMPAGGTITIITSQVVLNENDARYHGITQGKYAQITLTDTGIGMDKDTMRKIFDPFFTTKAIGHGTGLGLAMVYGIIRNHSGAITVESELNQGTTVTVLLPATDKDILPAAEVPQTLMKGSETVLLVDDEPMIIEIGQEILAAIGYKVLTASSGSEAIDIYSCNQDRIDFLIIDMVMPQMSGGELFDRLKEINPAIKVLLSSGYSIDGQAREILNRGCQGFLQKPFNISQLSVKIREILT